MDINLQIQAQYQTWAKYTVEAGLEDKLMGAAAGAELRRQYNLAKEEQVPFQASASFHQVEQINPNLGTRRKQKPTKAEKREAWAQKNPSKPRNTQKSNTKSEQKQMHKQEQPRSEPQRQKPAEPKKQQQKKQKKKQQGQQAPGVRGNF